MILSDIEKEIVEMISTYIAINIKTFLQRKCLHERRVYDEEPIPNQFGEIVKGDEIVVFRDIGATFHYVIALLSLVEKLQKAGLLYAMNKKNKEKLYLFYEEPYEGLQFDEELTDIFYEYSDKYYVPMIGLKEFIDNDYRTQIEIKEEKESKEREEERKLSIKNQERSFQQTRKIAYISIAVSIIVAITTTIINIKTYTNERNVKITYPEPSKVEIVNPEVKQLLEKNKPDTTNNNNIKVQLTTK